jgi:hypothetical protein
VSATATAKPTHLERAIAEGIQVEQINSRCWTASSSRGGQGYKLVVNLSSGQVFCDCPAGLHEIPCKHAALVAAKHAEQVAQTNAPIDATPVARMSYDSSESLPEPPFCCPQCGTVTQNCDRHQRLPLVARLLD